MSDAFQIEEYRGIKGLVYAKVIKDDLTGYEAGEVKPLAGIAELSRTTENGSESHYYDDNPAVVINSTGADTVTCSVSAIPLSTLADITGQDWDEDLGMFMEGERRSEYFAIGYITGNTSGQEMYVWRLKGKFSIPDSTHKTKTQGTEADGQQVVFTGIATTFKFAKDGKVRKAITVNASLNKADVTGFFDTVQTPDSVKAPTV